MAEAAGQRAVGVLLSGLLSDGVAGLQAIKGAGGITIVQAPADAEHGQLPRNALCSVDVDYVLAHRDIAAVLIELSMRPPPEGTDQP